MISYSMCLFTPSLNNPLSFQKMTTKQDLIDTLVKLGGKVEKRRAKLEREITALEDNETRQKIRVKYVTSKAIDVLKSEKVLSDKSKVKEDAINHLVSSMDFIVVSDKLLKEKECERGVMKNFTASDALKL